MRVMAVVPAHNEEKRIADTILSLQQQTHVLEPIVIVVDNCTDRTVEIASSFPDVVVFETIDNYYKKSGAINQYLETLRPDETDVILLMDADTILAPDAVEIGVKHFKDSEVAAVCSKAGVMKAPPNLKWYENLLYRLQKMEYAIYDSQRVGTLNNIKVVHGMAALHQWSAMQEAGLYNVHNLTEDYFLTLVYKTLGYRSVSEVRMRAWTEIPHAVKTLWKQRLRWYRGGVDGLRELGWREGTRGDILQHIMGMCLTILIAAIQVFFFYSLLEGSCHLSPLLFVVSIFYLYDTVYRVSGYCSHTDIYDWILVGLVLPMAIYGGIQKVVLWQAYVYSIFRIKQEW